jgi:hypothetical protein
MDFCRTSAVQGEVTLRTDLYGLDLTPAGRQTSLHGVLVCAVQVDFSAVILDLGTSEFNFVLLNAPCTFLIS